MALGTGRRQGRVQRSAEKNFGGRRSRGEHGSEHGRKHEWPIIPTIRRITRRNRVYRGGVDHAPDRVRITHRAAHDGRRTPLADSRTAARDRRQLRGGLDRAGRRRLLGRRGGRRGLRRGLRAGATSATTPTEATAPAASSTATTTSTAASSPTSASAASTGGRGTAASAASTAPATPAASGARTATEALALALAESPGADRASATPGRRPADVPQTDPQTAEERAVTGVPDAAHHRPGGVRRRRTAAAVNPLTRRDACPNGSY